MMSPAFTGIPPIVIETLIAPGPSFYGLTMSHAARVHEKSACKDFRNVATGAVEHHAGKPERGCAERHHATDQCVGDIAGGIRNHHVAGTAEIVGTKDSEVVATALRNALAGDHHVGVRDEVARLYRYEAARRFRDDVAHLSDLISPSGEAFGPVSFLASVKLRAFCCDGVDAPSTASMCQSEGC
ncbi:hypothetical protein N2605_25125 [Bradyrhizobium yuanmingense]|nr:hypothetical protein [Bradyrhizobium sp. CB1024]UWU82854.1 hypothetical protein N2605_25125 [Bradyrhizobium sp. CB1024]